MLSRAGGAGAGRWCPQRDGAGSLPCAMELRSSGCSIPSAPRGPGDGAGALRSRKAKGCRYAEMPREGRGGGGPAGDGGRFCRTPSGRVGQLPGRSRPGAHRPRLRSEGRGGLGCAPAPHRGTHGRGARRANGPTEGARLWKSNGPLPGPWRRGREVRSRQRACPLGGLPGQNADNCRQEKHLRRVLRAMGPLDSAGAGF